MNRLPRILLFVAVPVLVLPLVLYLGSLPTRPRPTEPLVGVAAEDDPDAPRAIAAGISLPSAPASATFGASHRSFTLATKGSAMPTVGLGLQAVAGVASLVCFVLVLIQMFQRGQTTLGVVCIVLAFCVGIGGLIAFIYGWVKSREWGLSTVMLIWTVCIVVEIVGNVMNPIDFSQFQHFGH